MRRIGSGGMAEVFLARTQVARGLNKSLVVKKIHPAFAKSKQFTTMFIDEAKIALGLNHPNIVQVFDFGTSGDAYYLAMELVEGMDLLRLMKQARKREQPIPLGLCAYVVQQVAKGLDYAHRKTDEYGNPIGIVHRDVSPQNVLVSWDGAVKIVDFGIARARHIQESDGVVKGKFAYMSPEQARGESVDRRSDVYSAGVILFEMCCGRPLFPGKGKEVLAAVKSGAIPRPRDFNATLPDSLEQVILKALSFHRDDRFQTARDLQRALGRLQFELARQEEDFIDSASLAQWVSLLIPAHRRTPTSMPPSAGELDLPPQSPDQGTVADGSAPGLTHSHDVPADTDAHSGTGRREIRQRKYVYVIEARLRNVQSIRAHLGTAQYRHAIAELHSLAQNIGFKFNAHVHRFSDGEMTFVIGLPIAGDDDAGASIRLILALREATSGIFQDSGIKAELSTGVQRGAALLIRGIGADFSYEVGRATTAIARQLASTASPGEVLVGGAVYRVAGDDWLFGPGKTVELPTTDSSVGDDHGTQSARVYSLLGARPHHQPQPSQRHGPRLIGRDLELKTLRDAYRDVQASGNKRQVLVVGEAGIGKHSLVSGLVDAIDDEEAIVIRTAARASTSFTPMSLIASLLREHLGIAEATKNAEDVRLRLKTLASIIYPGDESKQKAAGLIQAAGMIFGVQPEGEHDGDATERRQRLLEAMVLVEKRLAADRPLVLVIEDIHWADQESIEFFLEFMRAPARRGILAIATIRPDSAFVQTVRDAETDVLRVEELDERSRHQVVRCRFAEGESFEELAAQIIEKAGGNPFFINEILDSLVDQGVLQVDESSGEPLLRMTTRSPEISIPTSIEAVLVARIDQLPEPQKDVLMRGAVFGREFSAEALSADLQRSVDEDLHQLVVRRLVQKTPTGFAFSNYLTVQVAYSLIPYEERTRLHRRAAANLLASPAYRTGQDDAVVARHYELAGDDNDASTRYLRAAEHALDVGGNVEAFRLLSRALKLLDERDHEQRFIALRQREEILRRLARRAAQLRDIQLLLEQAEALGDPAKLATAYSRLAQYYIDIGQPGSAHEAIPAALDFARRAGDRIAEAEVLRLQSQVARVEGDHERSVDLSRAALELCGDDRDGLLQRALVLNNMGTTLWNMGNLHQASDSYAEALVIYRMLRLPRHEAQLLNNMGIVFSALGEIEEALSHFKSSLKIDQKLGDRAGIALKLGNIGQTYCDIGDIERGRRYLDKALTLTRQTDDRATQTDVLISLGQSYIRSKKPDLAVEMIERGRELAETSGDHYQMVRAQIYLAMALLASSSSGEDALSLAHNATDEARAMPMPMGEVYGLAVQAMALSALGRHAEAVAKAQLAATTQSEKKQHEGRDEILAILARIAEAADELDIAREALIEAREEVERRSASLRDERLRTSYLASSSSVEIMNSYRRLASS